MKNKILKVILIFLLTVPVFSEAGLGIIWVPPGTTPPSSAWNGRGNPIISLAIKSITWAKEIYNLLLIVIMIVFTWGIIKFIFTDDKEKGKTIVVQSIIALAVFFSIWGIIALFKNSFTSGSKGIVVPQPIKVN